VSRFKHNYPSLFNKKIECDNLFKINCLLINSQNNVELMEVLNNRKCEFMNNDKSRFRCDNHIYFLISLPEKKDIDNFQRLRLKTTV